MDNCTDDNIKIVKAKLRNYSSNFHDNFKNIENFIKKEVKKIEKLKFLQSNKIIELFHAISSIHLDGKEKSNKVNLQTNIQKTIK